MIGPPKTRVRVCGLYPARQQTAAPGAENTNYKLAWMARNGAARPAPCWQSEQPLVVGGRLNIIPQDEDAAQGPRFWARDALPLPRASGRPTGAILNLGFTEAIRAPVAGARALTTFWIIGAGAWERNNGIRIDATAAQPGQAADLDAGCQASTAAVSGPRTSRSDPRPVMGELAA